MCSFANPKIILIFVPLPFATRIKVNPPMSRDLAGFFVWKSIISGISREKLKTKIANTLIHNALAVLLGGGTGNRTLENTPL